MEKIKEHLNLVTNLIGIGDIDGATAAAQRLLAELVHEQIKKEDHLKAVKARKDGRPTADDVRSLLDYSPESGEFKWKSSGGGRRASGLAGSKSKDGYISIFINYKAYKAHRLAWLHCFGEWPRGPIDHINGNPGDNRISNLREATSMTNAQNRVRPSKNNAAGNLGIYAQGGKWRASITCSGKSLSLGSFATEEDAQSAYLRAKRVLHPGGTQ